MFIDLVYLRWIQMFCILEEFLCHVLIKPFINVDIGCITLCLLIWSTPCPSRCKNIRCPEVKTLVGGDVTSRSAPAHFFHFFHFFKKFKNCENSAEADLEVTLEVTSRSAPANFSLFFSQLAGADLNATWSWRQLQGHLQVSSSRIFTISKLFEKVKKN